MTNQTQRGGSESTNIQIGNFSTGLSYSDVRAIASDLFRQNFASLMTVAYDTANMRAEELREEIISRLERDQAANLSSFCQVEKQVALLEAQKAYALSGDSNLKEMLTKAIIEITKSSERSSKSIVLGEAIKVSPLLTIDQLKALGISFCLSHVNFGSVSKLEDLFDIYLKSINLKLLLIKFTEGDLRHLHYLGCGSPALLDLKIYSILKLNYPGLISSGYTMDQLTGIFMPDNVPNWILRPSPRYTGKFEIAAHRETILDQTIGLTTHQDNQARWLMNNSNISESHLTTESQSFSENARYLFNWWDSSSLCTFSLTSVGIAIGYMYIFDKIDLPDIDIWL